ncbi:MAG: hypothetical protein BWK73_25720 [Thiothrix lacustris]|uniref:OmpA-like domain-containing protein n=1 Tax=Thiothrix lacustris TaxID=525917 RepID=A0A1Y1QL58_9GAMM|nr:MAG: hypothetical protein BWK73_25720 [Thiothrix lacustris]
MHTLIARLTALFALSISAYADVPQFPDASMLPPGVSMDTDSAPAPNPTPTPGYTYPPSNVQPFNYNASQYVLPNAMLTPPAAAPMVMPSMPNFAWPNVGYGTMMTQPQVAPAPAPNTQQVDALNQSLNNLRQEYADLQNKTQQDLYAQERSIAELRKQLEAANQGKSQLQNQLTALKSETADNVKKADLDSCNAEKDALARKIAAMNQQVTDATAVTQQLTQLRQNLATLETEKQQLVSALEHETKDLDADGVPDKLDQCLDSALGVTVEASGCEPLKDGDKDGVVDSKDRCPVSVADAKVDKNGCDLPPQTPPTPPPAPPTPPPVPPAPPDSDKDGVADNVDLCADTAVGVPINPVGCAKTENINLKGVTFEKGSAVLAATSFPILDEAAATLKKYPDLKIEVGGHTDSSGDKVANEKLSQSRAEAVMRYLVEKGAKAELLSAKGYGPNAPIADNATPDGKAQNRRVELKILGQ